MNSLTIVARRLAQTNQRLVAKGMAATQVQARWITDEQKQMPEEEYFHGHLLADHLEYLDDMLEKTLTLESSLDNLKDTYAAKRQAYKDGSGDMDDLFAIAEAQKAEMTDQLALIKAALANKKEFYAVDAPDGTSDDMLREDLEEVNEIIDYAAEHEDKDKIIKQHEMEDAVKKDFARNPDRDW